LQIGFDPEFVRTGFKYDKNDESDSDEDDDIHDSQVVGLVRIIMDEMD